MRRSLMTGCDIMYLSFSVPGLNSRKSIIGVWSNVRSTYSFAVFFIHQDEILRLINRKIVRFISVNMTSFGITAVQPYSFM